MRITKDSFNSAEFYLLPAVTLGRRFTNLLSQPTKVKYFINFRFLIYSLYIYFERK